MGRLRREGEGSYTHFCPGHTRGMWSAPSPGFFSLGKEILFPYYRMLGGPRGRWCCFQKISRPHRISNPGPPIP